jgi:hypothetical protein
VPESNAENARKLPPEVRAQLRSLAHNLSNSLETILQAAYLLGQSKLDAKSKKWSELIGTAAGDAVRTNREIREILKSHC